MKLSCHSRSLVNHWGDHYAVSLKRLKGLMGKFAKDSELLQEYDRIINEQVNLGIVEKAPESYTVGVTNYLPHRPVIRENSATTKLRIVFDGSAIDVGGPTLNECLNPGPSLTPSLY